MESGQDMVNRQKVPEQICRFTGAEIIKKDLDVMNECNLVLTLEPADLDG